MHPILLDAFICGQTIHEIGIFEMVNTTSDYVTYLKLAVSTTSFALIFIVLCIILMTVFIFRVRRYISKCNYNYYSLRLSSLRARPQKSAKAVNASQANSIGPFEKKNIDSIFTYRSSSTWS